MYLWGSIRSTVYLCSIHLLNGTQYALYCNNHMCAQYNCSAVENKACQYNENNTLNIQQLMAPCLEEKLTVRRCFMMIGCWGRGQYIDPDKCEVSWSPLTNHQWPGTCSRHTLLLPPTYILQKSKVPFSFPVKQRAYFILFNLTQLKASESSSGRKCLLYNQRERNCRVFRWVRGNFETLCNGAAKVLKGCESIFVCKTSESRTVEEEVSMLHPYRMESYLIPPVSIFHLYYYINSGETFKHQASVKLTLTKLFIISIQQKHIY